METQGVLIHFVFQTKTQSFQDWSTWGAYKSQAGSPLPRGEGELFVLVVTPLLFKKALWLLSSLRKTVRHPTTECFQILQKCLKWFSLCFGSLWLIWSCPNYLFGCLRGTLAVTKVLGAFSSHPKVLATLMGPVESLRTWSSLAFIRKL